MSKHKLAAIFIAPFLVIGGYIAAGFFVETTTPMRVLTMAESCNPVKKPCLLETGTLDLLLSTSTPLRAGETLDVTIESSDQLSDVYVSFAQNNQQSEPYRLTEKIGNQWQGNVLVNGNVDVEKARLRLVINWKGEVYFADEKITQ